MSLPELRSLHNKKILVVENPTYLQDLKYFVGRLTRAHIFTNEEVPQDWTDWLLVYGVQAALMHARLIYDSERIIQAHNYGLPMVILVSREMRGEVEAEQDLQAIGIHTQDKYVGADCWQSALITLATLVK